MTEHTVQVGDVFVEDWGYDQSNIDFYVVTRVTEGGSVGLKPCGAKRVGEGHATRLVPDTSKVLEWKAYHGPDKSRVGKINKAGEVVKRVRTWGDDAFVTLTDYSSGIKWDGQRSYFDTYAAGYVGH